MLYLTEDQINSLVHSALVKGIRVNLFLIISWKVYLLIYKK